MKYKSTISGYTSTWDVNLKAMFRLKPSGEKIIYTVSGHISS